MTSFEPKQTMLNLTGSSVLSSYVAGSAKLHGTESERLALYIRVKKAASGSTMATVTVKLADGDSLIALTSPADGSEATEPALTAPSAGSELTYKYVTDRHSPNLAGLIASAKSNAAGVTGDEIEITAVAL